ncbi:MAG: tRNA (adenosine(37)-N6)-threonylcarbamoyltransferase complex dimerization subunit type 1 TsaB [Planctomycetota bacterium]
MLGIETAGTQGSVALLRPDRPAREVVFATSRRLGAELAPAIQDLLEAEGLGPDTPPDLVAVDTGPGSYTGLRIGLAAAKGLAFAWGRPLVGVPAVDALSAQAAEQGVERQVLCALDASRGEVYAALYERQEGELRLVLPGALTEPQAISARLAAPTLVVGDAAAVVQDAARGIVAAPLLWPSALRVAQLGRRRFMEGVRDDALHLAPIYYRPNEAEEQRRKRNMKEQAPRGKHKA